MEPRVKRPFEAVYEDTFSYVYNLIYMRVLKRSVAEDLTSEVFIKAYTAYDKYDPARAGERTWLGTIANRLLIDWYRSRASKKTEPTDDEILATIPCEDNELDRLSDPTNQVVQMMLAELNQDERALLQMRFMMEMKNPEIGEALGIAPKAVSERIRRLTEKCRKIAEAKKFKEWL